MIEQWHAFLSHNGAEFDAQGVLTSYGNAELENRILPQGAITTYRQRYGLIAVSGSDAESFLQNQITNDIKDVNEQQSIAAAWCIHNGKVISNFRIFKKDDSYYLICHRTMVEKVIQRLKMFVIMSDVTLTDQSDSTIQMVIAGERINEAALKACDHLPNEYQSTIQQAGAVIFRTAAALDRYHCVFFEREAAEQFWQTLNVHAAPVSEQSIDYLDVQYGRVNISEVTSEKWIPQMLNYQHIDLLNFNKGCYPGQEVVARVKYLGKNKRSLFRIGCGRNAVSPLDKLLSVADHSKVGEVASVGIAPNGHYEALVVANNEAITHAFYIDNEEAPCTLLKLGYSTEE